jgi:glycosyltransferase involved in cell wall biosynthesis
VATLGRLEPQGRPIRVTFVIGTLNIGGAETQLVRLANGLDRSRFTPSIISFRQGGALTESLEYDIPVTWVNLTLEPHGLARGRTILALRLLAAVVRGLRSQQPDVVHAYMPTAYVLGGLAASWLHVPLIVAGRRGLTSFDTYRNWRWRRLAKLANRVINVHICNSGVVRDWAIAKEGIREERTRIIYNGIDLPALDPALQLPPEWESAGPKAAMLANLKPYKGHREVLQAVALVAKRHPSFRLVLLGEGPERSALVNLAQELGIAGNVVFAGRRRDAATVVQAFDFTILGSATESFPNALMEAMACAVPVVATAVGGVPELVEDGIHGRLVPYGDPSAMAEAIAWMIEHPNERRLMGEKGRERIAGQFSTERMIRETEATYQELLPRRGGEVTSPLGAADGPHGPSK